MTSPRSLHTAHHDPVLHLTVEQSPDTELLPRQVPGADGEGELVAGAGGGPGGDQGEDGAAQGQGEHLVTTHTPHLCRGSLSSTLLLYCALLKLSCPAPRLHPWPGPRCRDTVRVVIENRSGLSSWVA